MNIEFSKVGKRFNRDWIFRYLNFQFDSGKSYAITGPNGSGKSTLLQIISGALTHNEGSIKYLDDGKEIQSEKIFKKVSFAAPYIELIEEMTLHEFFSFHEKMKGWLPGFDTNTIISILGLQTSSHKQMRYFSSGMKQRAKLAQAVFSNVPIILLDEPLSNLDEEGIQLYNSLVKNHCHKRLLVISSNDQKEYSFCDEVIDIKKYK
jgi:ABC-type multidrug transport system ATPase subunit